jgi:molybdate transport system substrate-binding protein
MAGTTSAHPIRIFGWPALVLVGLVAAGCGSRGGNVSPRPVVRVAAASDLQETLPALIERFGAVEPGVEVVPVFGASGQLARQIEGGAPFDVFLSANRDYVERLAAAKVIDRTTVRPYAVGTLVLVVGPATKQPVAGLADLARPEVKVVAIADPETAPYGAAARQALRKAGLWESLGPKLAVAGTVRQALQYVETGNAEVGLVSRSIAGVPGVRVIEIDPATYDPIVQALGVVARTSHRGAAEAFAGFLRSEAGRAVLRSHGFQLPDGP